MNREPRVIIQVGAVPSSSSLPAGLFDSATGLVAAGDAPSTPLWVTVIGRFRVGTVDGFARVRIAEPQLLEIAPFWLRHDDPNETSAAMLLAMCLQLGRSRGAKFALVPAADWMDELCRRSGATWNPDRRIQL
jgi:hypothetical protein